MIVIIGAGLSGLLTAYLLKKEGIPFTILEARNRIGGRINSIYTEGEAPVEMGATWFTNQHFNLINLLQELEIPFYEQKMGSQVFYQFNELTPTKMLEIPAVSSSYRIADGTSNLINKLFETLGSENVLLNEAVQEINSKNNSLTVKATESLECEAVVLAIPPKLWAKNINFETGLPEQLMKIALSTHTWMEDSIKVALTFKEPFWTQENIPATLFSNSGPVIEFYDHCDFEDSRFALCGFINSSFKQITATERKERVLSQLTNIYGKRILDYTSYEECVWSNEKFTFEDSGNSLIPHQNNGHPIFRETFFDDRLIISSSESASQFAGYMEGAVLSAMENVKKLKAKLN